MTGQLHKTASGMLEKTEATIRQAWRDVLQRSDISASDNFFEVGGDSLKAIEVIARLRSALGIDLPLIAFFEDPTIAHLAKVIVELSVPPGGAPVDDIQIAVEGIWREVLKAAAIGPTDNFFELGGDSLKAIEVISRLRSMLGVDIPLLAFFEDPTVAHLTQVVQGLKNVEPAVSSTQETVEQIWKNVLQLDAIEATANFFDLGGDSLKALDVISRLRTSFNVEIPLIAFFEQPTIAHVAAVVDELRAHPGATIDPGSSLHVGPLSLSYSQLMFWLLQQRDPSGHIYNEPQVFRIRGEIRCDFLQEALNEMGRRHRVLCTRYQPGSDEPVQVLDPNGTIPLAFDDLSNMAPSAREEAAMDLVRKDARTPFDLAARPPVSARLIKLSEDFIFAVVMHHIVADGYTYAIFFRELGELYRQLLAGESPSLPEAKQYEAFATWQRSAENEERLQAHANYWRKCLDGAAPGLQLPADKTPSDRLTYGGKLLSTRVSAETLHELKGLAQDNGSTLFTVMLAGLRILLHRWTQERDIVVGTVSSNRSWAGSEQVIGCFLNFLPLRTSIDPEQPATALVAQERRVVMDAFAHQEYPFIKIAQLGRGGHAESNPVYNVAFLLQNFPATKFSGTFFQGEYVELESDTALLDLRFIATEDSEGLKLQCEYKTDLFEESTAAQILNGFTSVLQDLVRNADRPVKEFPIPARLIEQAEKARTRDRKQRIAIASTFTAEPIEQALQFWMKQLGIRAEIAFAPYNQVFQELLDPSSLLSGNHDGFNVLLLRLTDWLRFEPSSDPVAQQNKIRSNINDLAHALKSAHFNAPVLVCICPSQQKYTLDPEWKLFLANAETALIADLGKVNGVHVISAQQVFEHYSVEVFEDEYADQLGHIPYTPHFFAAAGTMLARRIFSLRSTPKKVIVLDCDNTLWRGVCGEDGATGVCVDAPRRALQEFMLKQIEAGMLVCLCSKNAPEDVEAVFSLNEGMLLRDQHIAARRVNWNAKSQNLRELAGELQLGLDSFVFIDDNPIECAEVEQTCPEVLTLLLPQKAEDFAGFLKNVWSLDHWRVTEEDAQRTAMYRQNAEREQLRKQAPNLDEFLAGLELKLDITPVAEDELPRVSQLTERTNQFNFTTIRRNEAQIAEFLNAGGECLTVRLSDRFGDYGLVGVVLYKCSATALTVDTLLLSCRALGRKVEHRMLARLGEIARDRHLAQVVVPFVPTKKNQPALNFLTSVGTQFRRQVDHGFVYEFPATYVLQAPEVASPGVQTEEPAERPKQAPASPNVAWLNTAAPKIALELRDINSIVRAIEADRGGRSGQTQFVAPRTPVEEIVAGIWSRVLKLEKVGVNDDFFSLGGHSLPAAQVVARLRLALGVELPLRSLFEASKLADFAKKVEAAQRENKAALPPLTRRDQGESLPLSFAQQRLWFLDQLEPGNPIYNVPQMFRIRGTLDRAALEKSLNHIVLRHEALRTTFVSNAGEPAQIISKVLKLECRLLDLENTPETVREVKAQQAAEAEVRVPFDLTLGPLVRALLIRLATDDHILVTTMHHIVSDRWSMGVFSDELAIHYAAFASGRNPDLPALSVQYSDFAMWQREWLQGTLLEEQLKYWKTQLAGISDALQLPTDHPRPAQMSLKGAIASRLLPRSLVQKLELLSQTEGGTLFMTLLSAFQVFLARYSGQEDIVVGSPIAGRNAAEVEPLIGFFVNTLALRGDLSGDPSFIDLLARTKEACLEAYAHQHIPFEKLVEEVQPERRLNQNPVFQVLFALQSAPLNPPQFPGVRVDRVPIHTGTSIFDMSWFMVEVSDGLMARVEYSTDLFDSGTVERALAQLEKLLQSAVESPQRRISELDILDERDRHKVLVEFNATDVDFPRLCIHNLLEQSADRVPDATALICGEERISYRELNQSANRIAHRLIRLGAGPEVLIGVYLERTPDLVPSIFGVLKSGAAYVPLDPSYPQERLMSILEDSKAPIVLTQKSLAGRLDMPGVRFVCVDSERESLALEPNTNPSTPVTPDNLAYVLFTSGSTGRPKGVALEHHNNVTFVQWAQTVFTPEELAGVLFCTSIGFDMSTFEMFITAAAGGAMILAENPLYLPGLPAKNEVTLINTVPSAIAELVRMNALPPSVATVALAGEALPASLVDEIYRTATVTKVYNLYGPTESGYSTSTLVPRGGRVTIGKPIANEQCYIRDKNGNLVPIGVPGELYLAGEGVARGYFGRADLTAERFVANPYSGKKSSRMYRTGDLCRWLPDGNIEYLGRIDDQVKLRGFRIELGEIESVLRNHPAVQQCLVMAREDEPGIKRLVAYVVPSPGSGTSSDLLSAYLKESLPNYMIPSAFVELEAFPLTHNGKIDRRALPMPQPDQSKALTYVAPRTLIEEKIAIIWAELLHLDRVSADADFFALGGHSLLATQVISRLRQAFPVDIPLKAVFESPVLEVLAARIQSFRQGATMPPITRVPRGRPIPASFAQERLWFLDQLDPNNPVYNLPYTFEIRGPLDAAVMESALKNVVSRQEGLRTSFELGPSGLVQTIHEFVSLPFRTVDLSGLESEAAVTQARQLIAEDANHGFKLDSAPLMRALLVRIDPLRHLLLLNVHHIVTDRWSMGILVSDLAASYEAELKHSSAALPELRLQYADYTLWHREWLKGEEINRQITYWKKQLQGAPQLLELPTDRTRPATETSRGDVAYRMFSRDLSAQLNQFSHERGSTLFMTLLAGFQALLSRYSGQQDIVVGTAIANRSHPELEKVVGYFLNTLALRGRLEGDPSFSELVARAKTAALEAYAHQDVPFEKLVEVLRPERKLSHSPLVQVFFILQNAPTQEWDAAGLRVHQIPSGIKTAKGDLYLSMEEKEGALEARLEYNTDLFDPSTAENLLQHFEVLLEAAVSNPSFKLSELPLLAAAEKQQILVDWNATAASYPSELCLHELIQQQVTKTPDAIACIQPGDGTQSDRSITYRELNERANQLTRTLRALGAAPGQRVGIFIERSIEMMVGLLAIQKSGAAYIPLDPAYPPERIRLTLEDSQAPVLLTQESLLSELPEHNAKVICLDRDWPTIAAQSVENVGPTASSSDTIYVIFTSGSTGRPKGVQIPHRAVVNLLTFMARELRMGPNDIFPALASFAFDMCIPELYLALISGGRVVIGDKDLAANGEELAALLKRTAATVVHATPTTWRLLLDAGFSGKGLKRAIGAEPLPRELCQQLLAAEPSLYNFYGPTETTVWSTWHHFTSLDEPVVVGKPIANTQVYILDQHMQPVPAGIYGEIYIAGDGVAQGYLNRPDLTAEKFVPNPFSRKPDATMYRTGDLGRYLADGRIEFRGRSDHQVKLRGYRIELGEIESAIAKHPAVQQSVVIVREDVPGDRRLAAYVCLKSGEEVDAPELREWARSRLPEYMIPVAWVKMEKLPLSPNGKVDRRSLPAPEYQRQETHKYTAPRTPDEDMIAAICGEVLKIDRVGVEDNFFELGGHSLLATQVISRIRQAFNIDLPVRTLFESPTVASLAASLRSFRKGGPGSEIPPLRRIPRVQDMPLSFAQQRMWFLDQLEPGSPLYNVAYITRMIGEVNVEALEASLNEIVRRHETLRTTFVSDQGQPAQRIAPQLNVKIALQGVTAHTSLEEREAEARNLAAAEVQRPFDLSQGPLIRALLIKIAERDHALIMTTHHIISDRWSLGVFSHELATLYEAHLNGMPSPLPELTIQYADYAAWQRTFLESGVLETQLAYWRRQLEGAPAVLELPTDHARDGGHSFWGAQVRQLMPAELVKDVKSLSRREHSTFYMTLLAAFQVLISRWTGQTDVLVGTDLANRSRLETEKLIGFFVNLLPIRARIDPALRFTDFLQQIREMSLQAMANQDVPFEKLVEELRPERITGHNPLVQVLLVMQNTPPMVQRFGGLELKPLGVSTSSRFDLVMFINDPETSPSTTWMYNPKLFEKSTIERVADIYGAILRKVCSQPQLSIQELFASLEQWEAQRNVAEQQKFETEGREKLRKARRKAVEV